MAVAARRFQLTTAQAFWYVMGNIAFAGMYFAKVPVKKAMSEAGLCEMTTAERAWYVLQCIAFGAGYFAKLPVSKALTEASSLPPFPALQTAVDDPRALPGEGSDGTRALAP
jgi:hypothetical protein